MTIEIGSNRRVLEEEVRNRTKFENLRVLVPVPNDIKKMLENFSTDLYFSVKLFVCHVFGISRKDPRKYA